MEQGEINTLLSSALTVSVLPLPTHMTLYDWTARIFFSYYPGSYYPPGFLPFGFYLTYLDPFPSLALSTGLVISCLFCVFPVSSSPADVTLDLCLHTHALYLRLFFSFSVMVGLPFYG